MIRKRVRIYAVFAVVGIVGAAWIARRADRLSTHDYAQQSAERKRQNAVAVKLSEGAFTEYVKYAFLFSVKESSNGSLPVGMQAGTCLAVQRARAGQPTEAWTPLVAKATADMVMGAQVSTATPNEADVHRDNPIVQNVLRFGQFESMVATIGAFRERIETDSQSGALPDPNTEEATQYGEALRTAFVQELTSHPQFESEFRAHLQRVSDDTSYPLPSIRWSR